jgi:microcystin-dependent protein
MRRSGLLLLLASLFCLFSPPAAHAQIEPFVGQIMIVPYNFAPVGFADCDGQLLSIAGNTALFSLLGTTYGGDGRSTFALPDLQGRVPIGLGQGPGLQEYDMGETGGVESVTLTVSQIPSHTHGVMGSASTANTGSPTNALWATPRVLLYSAAVPNVAMNALALGTAGGSAGVTQPHENRKPFLVMRYIIAMRGIYPSRS